MRRFLIPGLLAALLVTGAGCSSPGKTSSGSGRTTSSPEAKDVAAKTIGKTVTVKDDADSADVTLVSVGSAKEGQLSGTKADSGNFVVLNLKIVGKTGSFSTNSLYVWLKTAAGKTVKSSDGMGMIAQIDPDLPLKDLHAGEEASGNVLIDTPAEPGAKMVWVSALDEELASWDL